MKKLPPVLSRKVQILRLSLVIPALITFVATNSLAFAIENRANTTVTSQTQLIAQKLTCLFETGKAELSTEYIENLGDGRGYTCGWAGFTTADEEVVACVEEYTRLVPNNSLAPMLPELRRLQQQGSDDVSKLDDMDFETQWQTAAATGEFQRAYASVVERIFGDPARDYVRSLGLKLPVSYAVLFDSVIQHGNGDDPDGVPALIARTKQQTGDPTQDEKAWLLAFLDERQQTLENPTNGKTAAAWRESVPRVEALRNIVNENAVLQTPIHVKSKDYDEEIE